MTLPPSAPAEPKWAEIFPSREAVPQRKDASVEWRRIVPELNASGYLALVDFAALTDYCVCWAQLRAATRELGATATLEDEPGQRKLHPAASRENQLRGQLAKYRSELFLSPGARTRATLGATSEPQRSVWTG